MADGMLGGYKTFAQQRQEIIDKLVADRQARAQAAQRAFTQAPDFAGRTAALGSQVGQALVGAFAPSATNVADEQLADKRLGMLGDDAIMESAPGITNPATLREMMAGATSPQVKAYLSQRADTLENTQFVREQELRTQARADREQAMGIAQFAENVRQYDKSFKLQEQAEERASRKTDAEIANFNSLEKERGQKIIVEKRINPQSGMLEERQVLVDTANEGAPSRELTGWVMTDKAWEVMKSSKGGRPATLMPRKEYTEILAQETLSDKRLRDLPDEDRVRFGNSWAQKTVSKMEESRNTGTPMTWNESKAAVFDDTVVEFIRESGVSTLLNKLPDGVAKQYLTEVATSMGMTKEFGGGNTEEGSNTPPVVANRTQTTTIPEGTRATNPNTGEVLIRRDGQWQPIQ